MAEDPHPSDVRLEHLTWREVEAYLDHADGILIPTGSTEQHGPMGLIGTDTICATSIAHGAAREAGALVTPALALTPAPFNMAFPGTMSVSAPLFESLLEEIADGLFAQGFGHLYFINGHGANVAPLGRLADSHGHGRVRIRSWWDFEPVNALRHEWYGDWEGMHATPSEVAITQAVVRTIAPTPEAIEPPRRLSPEFIRDHAGDRHGPPDSHRRDFPDGRVGSHSALARPEHGQALLDAAVRSVAEDYRAFVARD